MEQHITEKLPHVRSVLVVRHGQLVFEKYYQETDRNSYHEVASVTKSFTSALVGVALKLGYIKSLDQKMMDFFPEYVRPDSDPKTKEITLKHLLTMTTGRTWSERDLERWTTSGDWFKYAVDLPMSEALPGTKFNYETPASHQLLRIVAKTSGMSASKFAETHLFKPLGISTPQWRADYQGHNTGGFGISMKARDLAKFGYLYLHQGEWDGKQIIPADYVKESTRKQNEGGFPENEGYGYQWWVTTVKGHEAYFAGGFGGQFIYVVPDLDIVVIIASNLDRPHIENRNIVGEFIIPAVVKK